MKLTTKQIGDIAQKMFEDAVKKKYGKTAFLHRLPDTSDIRARYQGKTVAHLPKQPADYHIIAQGQSFYAEVKGTTNKTRFPFSQLEAAQLAGMKKVLAAGGEYVIFVYSFEEKSWYRISAQMILSRKDAGKASLAFKNNQHLIRFPGVNHESYT